MKTTFTKRFAALFAVIAAAATLADPYGALSAAPGLPTDIVALERRIGSAQANSAIAAARAGRIEILIAASRQRQQGLLRRLEEARAEVEREGGVNSIRNSNAKRLKQMEYAASAELEALAQSRKLLLRRRARSLAEAAVESRRGSRLEVLKLTLLATCRNAETPAADCSGAAETDPEQESR